MIKQGQDKVIPVLMVKRSEFDTTISGLREDVTQIRISLGKLDARMDIQEKAMDKLTEKVDGFTWKFSLGIAVVVLAQVTLKFVH